MTLACVYLTDFQSNGNLGENEKVILQITYVF